MGGHRPAWHGMRHFAMRRLAGGLALAAWFLYFSRDVLAVHFAPDDMMNADNFYWTPGLWRLFYSQLLIWRGYYRPMGGLFYVPILSVWGLNPAPYHVTLSLVLAVNVYLVYRLARILGAPGCAAGLAALVACYHAGLANLYYNTAFVYDALCGCFFLASLVHYCGIRARGRLLSLGQKAIFGVLVLCALNSKEMALTLPALLLAYEWIYQWTHHWPFGQGRRSLMAWVRGPGSPVLIAACLTLLDFYGKVFGYDALTGMEGYRPVFTWKRFLDYQKIFVGDAAFWHAGGTGVLVFWVVVSYLAWRPGARPVLRFCWALLVFAPLPIEFLLGKSQACLYIPMLGLATFAAVIVADLAVALAGGLAGEPLFRLLRRPVISGCLIAAAIFYWGRENLHRKQSTVKPVMAALGAQTWQVIEQFRALDPHVRPHCHVVFLNDPFTEWDMLFIADLWFRDRSVTVHLQRMNPIPQSDVARAEAVFDYGEGRLFRIK